jgi:hypothetical protein
MDGAMTDSVVGISSRGRLSTTGIVITVSGKCADREACGLMMGTRSLQL